MDDLTRDSWTVMRDLEWNSEELEKAKRRQEAASLEVRKLEKSVNEDTAIIRLRLEQTGSVAVVKGKAVVSLVPGSIKAVDTYDLDFRIKKLTGIEPGPKAESDADPADMVDLTQPVHEAVTAPSAN